MDEKKRVVHLTTVHHPHDPRIYYKQCLSLAKAGYDVFLIAQVDEKGNKVQGPKHIPLKSYSSRLKRIVFGTIAAYRKAKKLKADIYHFHDPELLPVGWLLKRKNNIVIYDIHEDYVTSILQKEYLPKWIRSLMAKLYKGVEKVFSRRMELCLAEKYYKDLYKRGKCILNYPLLQQKFLAYERKDESFSNQLLYTGNVTEDRGAFIHAQIPKIAPTFEVHFVGKCARSLYEKMLEIVGDEKERLHFEGIDQFITRDRIDQVYFSNPWLAGLAIFPETDHYKQKELTKFFEYMAAGLPIVCSNFPVWQQFIDTYQCGVTVDPNDPEAIRNILHDLKNNPIKAREMGRNGKRAVIEMLNWSTEEKKLLTWYEELLLDLS